MKRGAMPKSRSRKRARPTVGSVPAAVPHIRPPAPPPSCRNCGRERIGPYCSHCGQEHIEDQRPGRRLLREWFRDEFQFNSRVTRTVVPLLFRPGALTLEYLAGRRQRYLPPLRMYVFISVAMFALLAAGAGNGRIPGPGIRHRPAPASAGNGQPADSALKRTSWHIGFEGDTAGTGADHILPEGAARESLAAALEREAPDDKQGAIAGRMREGLVRTMRDPKAFVTAAVGHSGQAMFIVMPLVALLLKLLYLRRKRRYLEHLIFTLHVHAFVFLVLALALGTALIAWPPLAAVARWLLWSIPVYAFIAIRRVYGQGPAKTLVKFCLLGIGYAFLLIPALVAVVMASLLWL